MMKNPGGLFKVMLKQGIGMAPVPGLGLGVSSMESLLGDSGISGRALAATILAREKDETTLAALRQALAKRLVRQGSGRAFFSIERPDRAPERSGAVAG